MDQLLAIRTFVRIAEAGSFAKAADLLNLPRSTVSKQIQDLEEHLGAKLIQRTTRTVTITPEGAAYYERSLRLIAELDEMNATAAGKRTQPKGRLRVDIGSSLASLILIPALPDFRERYPSIEILLGVSDRPVDLVGDAVDCAVRGGELADTSLVARRICELDYVTCASREYVAAHGTPMRPSELEGSHQIIGYFSSMTGRPHPLVFRNGDRSFAISGPASVSVNESTAHMTALLAGLGVGQTFRFVARPYLETGALVPLLEEWTRPRHPLHVIYPSSRHLNAKLRVFVDWVAQIFAGVDDAIR